MSVDVVILPKLDVLKAEDLEFLAVGNPKETSVKDIKCLIHKLT